MTAQQLKNSVLQLAVQGKLVPQDPNDEPASVLLERIRKEKEKLIKEGKIKKEKNPSVIFRGADNTPYEKVGDANPASIAEEIPFDIPDSWEWVRLGTICEIARGGSPRPIKQFLTDSSDGINWIKIGDSDKGGKYINSTKEKIIPEGVSKSRMVYAGDFLLTNSMSFGRPYILNVDGCIHDGWLVLSGYQNCFDRDYLFYLLSSRFAYFQFCDVVSGAVVKNLNSDKVASALFPLPPFEEQKRIVKKIDTITPLINEYEKAENPLAELQECFSEKLKKSVLQYAVQGKLVQQNPNDEPASVLLERIRAEKQRLVQEGKIKKDKSESIIFRRDNSHYEKRNGKEVCIDEEIPFELPESWCWCRLGTILKKITDGTHSTPKYTSDGVPFISVKDLSHGHIDFSNTKHVSEEEHKTMYMRCDPKRDDILLTKVGTTGIPVLVETDIEFSLFVSVAQLRFSTAFIDKNYLVYLIKSPLVQDQCKEHTRGVGNKNWVINDIINTLIALPPLNEQHRIVSFLDNVMPSVNKLKFPL